MLAALGHCEDPACLQKNPPSSNEHVRLFRCSIHCNKNLCLSHLNAHNVYYEQEKRQNDLVTRELETALGIYQKLFEQHIATYHELVRQASTIIYHNTSTMIPTEQIRNVLTTVRRAITIFEQELIKPDTALDVTLLEIKKEEEKNVITLDDDHTSTNNADKENDIPVNTSTSTENTNTSLPPTNSNECQKFVVRIPRIDSINTDSSIEVIRNDKQNEIMASPKGKKRSSEGPKTRAKSTKRLQK
ncbi:hypothetical protein I4U23_014894 [Adineta vaga]|nr:hypothetical protein I4U23_014894 [Adineta vaga]